MMNTAVSAGPRPLLVASAWVLVIIAATLVIPAGGLVAAIAAALTTYKRSNGRTKALLLAVGVVTVVLQASPAIVMHREFSGSTHPVEVR